VVTTLMVARKVLENWLYWVVINIISVYLFLDRELYQTAGLLVLYVILAIVGYAIWLKRYQQELSFSHTGASDYDSVAADAR